MSPVYLLRGVVVERGLGSCLPSAGLVDFFSRTPRSVLDDCGAEDVFVYVTCEEDVERYLEEREEASVLWVRHPGLKDGEGHVHFSTRLLGPARHMLLPVKKAKVVSNRRQGDRIIKDDPPYRIVLPSRAVALVRRVNGFLMPLLDQLLDDLQDSPAVAANASQAQSEEFLEDHGTALFSIPQGVQLVRACNGGVKFGVLQVNLVKAQLELGILDTGQASPRGNCCAVLGFKDAVNAFNKAVSEEAAGRKRSLLAPTQWSSEPSGAGRGGAMAGVRGLAGADPKRRKEYLEGLLHQLGQQQEDRPALQRPDVLRSLLAAVAGCDGEMRPIDAEIEQLAQRVATELLQRLPPGRRALSLEKFMEGVQVGLQKGPATGSLAVLRLLQFTLPLPGVTKAALSYGLVDVLTSAYGALTTASLRPLRTMMADAAAAAATGAGEGGEEGEIVSDLFTRSMRTLARPSPPANSVGGSASSRRSNDRGMARRSGGGPVKRVHDAHLAELRKDLSEASNSSSLPADSSDPPSTDKRPSKRPSFVPPLQLGAANLAQGGTPKAANLSAGRSLRLALPQSGHSPNITPTATPILSPRSFWVQAAMAAGEGTMAANLAFYGRMRRTTMPLVAASCTPAASDATDVLSHIHSAPNSPSSVAPQLSARLALLNCLHLLSPLHTLLPEALGGSNPRAPLEQELIAACHHGSVWLSGGPAAAHLSATGTPLVQQWRELALQVLHSYSPAVARHLRSARKGGLDMMKVAQMQSIDLDDALLRGVTEQLLSISAIKRPDASIFVETQAFLQLLTDYLSASGSTRLPAAVIHTCGEALAYVEQLVSDSGRSRPKSWPRHVIATMASLLKLYTVLLQRAASPAVRRLLVNVLLQRAEYTTLTSEFARLAMFSNTFEVAAGGARAMAPLWTTIWAYYTALAQLLEAGVPPPPPPETDHMRRRTSSSHVPADDTAGPAPSAASRSSLSPHSIIFSSILSNRSASAGPPMTAAEAAAQLKPLLQHPDGLAELFLKALLSSPAVRDKAGSSCLDLQLQILSFMRAALSVPGSPFLLEPRTCDHYVHFHFQHFTSTYEALATRPAAYKRCYHHLQVLQALAKHNDPHIRYRFHDIKIMDFLTHELSAEWLPQTATIAPSDIYCVRPPSMRSSIPSTPISTAPISGRPPIPSGHWPTASGRRPTASGTAPIASSQRAPIVSGSSLTASGRGARTSGPRVPPPPPPLTSILSVSTPTTVAPSPFSPNTGTTPSASLNASFADWSSSPRANRASTPYTLMTNASSGPSTPATATPVTPFDAPLSAHPISAHPITTISPTITPPRSPTRMKPLSPTLEAPPSPNNLMAEPPSSSSSSSSSSNPPILLSPPHRSPSAQPLIPRPSVSSASPSLSPHPTALPQDALLDPPVTAPSFNFCYDLEEDVERLLLLEEQMGHSVDLGGLSRSSTSLSVPLTCSPTSSRPSSPSRNNSPSPSPSPSASASPCRPSRRPPSPLPARKPPAIPNLKLSLVMRNSGTLPSLGTPSAPPPVSPLPRAPTADTLPQLDAPLPSPARAANAPAPSISAPIPRVPSSSAASGAPLIPRLALGNLTQSSSQNLGPPPAQSASSSSSARLHPSRANSLPAPCPSPNRSTTPPLPPTHYPPIEDISRALSPLQIPPAASSHSHNSMNETLLDHPPFTIHPPLHVLLLELIIDLLLTPNGTLDPRYCVPDPATHGVTNILYILHCHLTSPFPSLPSIIAQLLQSCQALGPASTRLLRLLVPGLFRNSLYHGLHLIGRGQYASVYEAQLQLGASRETVIIKSIDTPRSLHDPCTTFDAFNEISILEAFSSHPEVCQLLDYGISNTSYWLVLKRYRCTLRHWRSRRPAGCEPGQVREYLRVFQDVVEAAAKLADSKVVHYDLKCDNVLLEVGEGVGESEFWGGLDAPRGGADPLPFKVVLADFGESVLYTDIAEAYPDRSRGTEVFMSPEMLAMAPVERRRQQRNFDRRKQHHSGFAHDVWSLGCLFFELLTDRLLFVGEDQKRYDSVAVTHRVLHGIKGDTTEVLTPFEKGLLAHHPPLLSFFQWLMVRDAATRPTLPDLQSALARLLAVEADAELPQAALRAPLAAAPNPSWGADLEPLVPAGRLEGPRRVSATDAASETTSIAPTSESAATVAADTLQHESSDDPLSEAILLESMMMMGDPALRPHHWHVSPSLSIFDASFLPSAVATIHPPPTAVLLLTSAPASDPTLDPTTQAAAQALTCAAIPFHLVPIPPPSTIPTASHLTLPLMTLIQTLAASQRISPLREPPSQTHLLYLLPPTRATPRAGPPQAAPNPPGTNVLLAATPDLLPQAALIAASHLLPSNRLSYPHTFLTMSKLGLTHLLRGPQLRSLSHFAAARQQTQADLTAPGRMLVSCLCGAFTASLSPQAANSPSVVAPRPCCGGHGDEPLDCPADCAALVADLQEQYGWSGSHLLWSNVSAEGFCWDPLSPLISTTSEASGPPYPYPGSGRGSARANPWVLHQCACCSCPVFAAQRDDALGSAEDSSDVAVVVNWRLERPGL